MQFLEVQWMNCNFSETSRLFSRFKKLQGQKCDFCKVQGLDCMFLQVGGLDCNFRNFKVPNCSLWIKTLGGELDKRNKVVY